MAATAVLEKEDAKLLLNRSTDCHPSWQENSIGEIVFEKLVKYEIFTQSKMAATAILKIDKVLKLLNRSTNFQHI